MKCCDIPAYLDSFPQTWRDELTSVLCEILAQKANVDCPAVKACETLTSITPLTLVGNVLSFTYFDEHGVGQNRSINLTPVAMTSPYTFANGLYVSGSVVKLGLNLLVEDTAINLSTFKFSIVGEEVYFPTYESDRAINDAENGTYLFTNAFGKLGVGHFDGNVQNGLSYNLPTNKFELGGALIKDTTVDASGFSLSFAGELIKFPAYLSTRITDDTENGTYLFTDTTGNLKLGKWTDSVNNGLTFDGVAFKTQLGGALVKNTTITTGAFNLDLSGENIRFPTYLSTRNDTENGSYLFTDTNGKLNVGKWSDSVINGLRFDGVAFKTKLGGDLIEPTTIGATNTDADLITNNLWIKNNIGIGDNANTTSASRAIIVHSAGTTAAKRNTNPFYVLKEYLDTIPTAESYGLFSSHNIRTSSNLSFTGLRNGAITGSFGYLPSSGATPVITGDVNVISSRLTIASATPGGSGGNIESIRLLTASSSFETASSTHYTGTISNLYGLYIEDLSSGLSWGNITNAWGIYQSSATNKNWLRGVTAIGVDGPAYPSSQYNFALQVSQTRSSARQFNIATQSYLANFDTTAHAVGETATPLLANYDMYLSNTLGATYTIAAGATDTAAQFSMNYANAFNNNIAGTISAIKTRGLFSHFIAGAGAGGTGIVNNFTGIIVDAPTQLGSHQNFTGTITDVYGIHILNQRTSLPTATITRSWGIVQDGPLEVNIFAGPTKVGGTTAPHASAVLQVDSTTKGFVVPRMTGAQVNALILATPPTPGLILFITDNVTPPFDAPTAVGFYGWDGVTWKQF